MSLLQSNYCTQLHITVTDGRSDEEAVSDQNIDIENDSFENMLWIAMLNVLGK